MFKYRKIYSLIKDHSVKKQITVVTGVRRSGKTTIVKQLLQEIKSGNKIYIDLERIDNRKIFDEPNYENIIHALKSRGLRFNAKSYIAIDEIQLSSNIPSVLKYIYDNYDVKFIITGSSSYYIKNHFTESLAGRKKIFELYPLDFAEFLFFKDVSFRPARYIQEQFDRHEYDYLTSFYNEYIEYGGFPEVSLTSDVHDKKDLLLDIISSYINIDIKTFTDFRNENAIHNLLKMLGSRVGSKLDYSKISSLTGLSRPTVQGYIDLFEKTYLISRIPVFTVNPDREIVKAQKIYFNDTGLVKVLSNINSGSLFENAVFNQLKHFGKLQYYSLKTGREIDFIQDHKTAFEVKETPAVYDLKYLKNFSEKAGIKQFRLIGRHASARFTDFIWGGSIR